MHQAQQNKKVSKQIQKSINKKNEEKMPFTKQLSREKINQIIGPKDLNKPVGYYQPKYSQIDKSVHLVWNQLDVFKNRNASRGIRSLTQRTAHQEKPDDHFTPEKVSKRVIGFIDYDRQLDREKVIRFVKNDPHEKRFEVVKQTQVWSNLKRVPQFFYNTSLGRDENKIFSIKEHQPDYQPNYEYFKKNLGKAIPNFTKVPPRQPYYRSLVQQSIHTFDYDYYVKQNKSHVYRSVQNINLKKMQPRAVDPNSPMPSFMQKHVNQRQTLTNLHYKMLEQNHFFDGRFQSTRSPFDTLQQSKKKKMSESDQDILIEQEAVPKETDNNENLELQDNIQ